MLAVDPIFLISAIIFLGYFALLLFEKKRISQIITLTFLGILLATAGIVDTSPSSVIYQISPFLATLALIFLLFDGGLNLNIVRTAKEFPRAFLFTTFVFILSSLSTAALLMYWPGMEFLKALLVGTLLGGTSSAVIITIVEQSRLSGSLKTLLTLESTITDLYVVISSSILIELIVGKQVDANISLMMLTSSFTTSTILGIIAAFSWVYVLSLLDKRSYSYMLTIAMAFLLYSISNFLGGSGNFAVFVFALLLGNMGFFRKFYEHPALEEFKSDREIKRFQEEITFFIRTFFFVYMGLLLPIDKILKLIPLIIVTVLTFVYLLIRILSVKLFIKEARRAERFLASTALGRGLAAAVMASIIVTMDISIPYFVEIVLGVILFTNIITTWGLYTYYKYIEPSQEQPKNGKNGKNGRGNNKGRRGEKKGMFLDWAF